MLFIKITFRQHLKAHTQNKQKMTTYKKGQKHRRHNYGGHICKDAVIRRARAHLRGRGDEHVVERGHICEDAAMSTWLSVGTSARARR